MAVKKTNKKRKLNSALKAWNDARSYISKENKKQGGKYNGVELNDLTKSFLLHSYGTSWDSKDLDLFLTKEVVDFYSNPLNVSFTQLLPRAYYMIDGIITNDMPKGINIVISAAEYGTVNFNTKDYDYGSSGVRDIVEEIRKDYFEKPSSEHPQFSGFIRQVKKGKVKYESNDPNDYYIDWVLYIDGEYAKDVSGSIPPKAITKEEYSFNIKTRKKKKKLKATSNTKGAEIKKDVKYSAKELIEIEKQKQKTIQEEIKAKKETIQMVSDLVKLGYTKKEINKLLGIK